MAGKNIPVLLVTANVGSIFEDPSVMLKIWTEEFLQTVARLDPKFIAIHCQEVGGKNYERSMKHVQFFVRLLMSSEELRLFDKVRIYLDEDFSSAENFTALGNFYFIHESLNDVLQWDFAAMSFVPATGKEVHSGNIEAVTTKEKSKFPQDFFPSCKWSRKGFLRTRWSLDGTVIDLINIHLFHDASNFVAMEMYPSVYCTNRRRALEHTLDRFHTDAFGTAPFFVFGDFNFRTDTKGVVKKLSEGLSETRLQSQKTDVSKMQYQDESSQVVLSLGKKEFSHRNHQSVFEGEDGKWLKAFDCELDSFAGRLFEFPIAFGPSYPFEENENGAKSYMKTRCPSWCDRVILSNTATSLVNNFSDASGIEYNVMGANTCMGDHKPVYLSLRLQSGAGTVACCPLLRGSTACLNGLSRFPPLDTLTLPRGPRVHDEPYTPESMDTPSPLPSPIPSELNQSHKTFNDSVAARLQSVGNDELPGYRKKRGTESPFHFTCSDVHDKVRQAECVYSGEWMVDSPRVLVTEYSQMGSVTLLDLGDNCFQDAKEAASFNELPESRCSNSVSTPVLNTLQLRNITSERDKVIVRDNTEGSIFNSRSLLTESDLCLAKLAGERPNNRLQSQSVSEFTVSASEYDKGLPLRADRCFSDASWLRQKRRVRLISENESITRLQSHHSSSDEDWFEEDAESDVAVINSTDSQHVPSDEVNGLQKITSAGNAFNNNVDVTKELSIICPPQEICSSLLNGIADGMSMHLKVKKPDYEDNLSEQESKEFLKLYNTSSVAVEVGSSTEHNISLKASRNSLTNRGRRRGPRKNEGRATTEDWKNANTVEPNTVLESNTITRYIHFKADTPTLIFKETTV